MWKYYKLDAQKFLRESHSWGEEIKKIQASENPDEARIAQLKRYTHLKKRALRSLPLKQLECIEAFYGPSELKKHGDQLTFWGEETTGWTRNNIRCAVKQFKKKYGYDKDPVVHEYRMAGMENLILYLYEHELEDELDEFYSFDITQFLKDSGTWKSKIKERKEKLKYTGGIKAISYDKVGGRSNLPSDPVFEEVLENEYIIEEINRLEMYERAFRRAVDTLDDLGRGVIYVMYQPQGNEKYRLKGVRMEEYANECHVAVRTAERYLEKAKSKMRNHIEQVYFGKDM